VAVVGALAAGYRSRPFGFRRVRGDRLRFRALSPGRAGGTRRLSRISGSDREFCPLIVPRNDDYLSPEKHGILED
jgi:hypothetical protein